ncbi:alpha/beta hydrolase [bacterium]|nr:alpha/beta hydrolase [candidate division CSSED10-310 bacterium]
MFARINGVQLYYEVSGKGIPVVMTLHGGPGIGDGGDNKRMFKLLEDEFTFVYFDQRGNGQSDDANPSTYTHRQIVEDTESLRRHLGIGRMALSGGSYGGMLAMEYALVYPDNLTHMILRGTAASSALQEYAFENALAAGLPGVSRSMLENLFYGHMKSDDDLKEHFARIYPLYSRKYTPGKARKLFEQKRFRHLTHNAFFQHAFPEYDIRARLKDIRVKTLIMTGRHDWITPLKFAGELRDGLPNARLEIFEDAGHSINADMPDQFREVIRSFLKEQA